MSEASREREAAREQLRENGRSRPRILRSADGKLSIEGGRPALLTPDSVFATFAGTPEDFIAFDVLNVMLERGYTFQHYVVQSPDFVLALFADAVRSVQIAAALQREGQSELALPAGYSPRRRG